MLYPHLLPSSKSTVRILFVKFCMPFMNLEPRLAMSSSCMYMSSAANSLLLLFAVCRPGKRLGSVPLAPAHCGSTEILRYENRLMCPLPNPCLHGSGSDQSVYWTLSSYRIRYPQAQPVLSTSSGKGKEGPRFLPTHCRDRSRGVRAVVDVVSIYTVRVWA